MISELVKNNIKNNLVYHASPFKLDILSGQKTSTWSNEVGNVFVTPCKGIAACFLINKNQILDKLTEQFSGKIIGLNFGYDIWNKPVEELYKIPSNINILLNLPNVQQFSGTSTGYIYTIDFFKYKNHCHMFNKNPNSDVEFLIEGDVDFVKCQQVTVNWTCSSSQEEIKRHGIAKIIECYDPPYTYQQMINAGYSLKLAQKLKNDPVHGWRMSTGIELVHQQPSIAEQKRVWKNWQLMSPEQKEISQKKSLEFFGKTNQQHYKEIMQNYWKEPITESIIKTGDSIIIIYPQPNLQDQRILWKKWLEMTPEQKKISDKRSLQFYHMTNKEHNNFIMQQYWNAPILESKFQKLFNIIMEETNFQQLNKIINFASTDLGQLIIDKIKKSLNNTLKIFKLKFPQFKNVQLNFDIYQDQLTDIYAEVFPENLNIIYINLFPFLEKIYYAFVLNKNLNNILNNMLLEIQNGTYEDMQYPLIIHELAHIADFKNNPNIIDPHGTTWKNQINRLFNLINQDKKKYFSSFDELKNELFSKNIPIKFNDFNENITKVSILSEIQNICKQYNINFPEELAEINFLQHFIKSENTPTDIHGINYLNININRFFIGIAHLINIIFKNIYLKNFKSNFNIGNLREQRLNYSFEDKFNHLTYTVICLITTINPYEFSLDFLTIYENKNQKQNTKIINITTDKNILKNEFNAGKNNKIIFENKHIKIQILK